MMRLVAEYRQPGDQAPESGSDISQYE
jgi:hypothetical protein